MSDKRQLLYVRGQNNSNNLCILNNAASKLYAHAASVILIPMENEHPWIYILKEAKERQL